MYSPQLSALTIAASDPCGGAGIQADLRVFYSQGIAGLSAITALTVQDTRGVRRVAAVPEDLLYEQIRIVLDDVNCAAVKIGLVPNISCVRAVTRALRECRPPNIVLDPVMASTGGAPFLDKEGRRALIEELLPLCDLVTPNLHETVLLSGLPAQSPQDRAIAAEFILQRGARAVLVKGGHLDGDPEDLLVSGSAPPLRMAAARIETPNTHGTGCFLSSAIAARLALGDTLIEAVHAARALLRSGLLAPLVVGTGRGSPGPFAFGTIRRDFRTHAQRIALLRGIYVVTDSLLQGSRTHADVASEAFAAGAHIVQLRDKQLSTPRLIEVARQIAAVARQWDGLFIVNDRVDVAAASEADGVHLGPDDMRPSDARRILGLERLIGVSVGTVEDAIALQLDASYFGVGAIYSTQTKSDAGPPVGPQRIREIADAVPGKPLVAIGGIGPHNIREVGEAGAISAAAISAILTTNNIADALMDLQERFKRKS